MLAKGLGLYLLWRITTFFLRPLLVRTQLDKIPGPASKSYLTGILLELYDIRARQFHRDLLEKYGSVIKIKGLLGTNQLYVTDPRALYHIIIKDQYIFEETRSFIEINRLVFGEGILASCGEQHRKHRKMLNPVFAASHMRELMPIFYGVSRKVMNTFSQLSRNGPCEVDMLSWMTRLALELIGQSGLGHSFDPLTEHAEEHPFSALPKEFIPATFQILFFKEYILPPVVNIGSARFRRWIVDTVPLKAIREVRDVVDIMHNTSIEIFESKKAAFEKGDEAISQQIAQGKDIISILMRANMDASAQDRLSDTELLGQLTSLTFAAMDTTSGALTHIIHLLAQHQDVQDKLREEVLNARQGADLGFDELLALPYLDAICRETLRMYPPVSFLQRTATQDVILPFSSPVHCTDGSELDHVLVPKGTTVIVPVLSANVDPRIWGPDSHEWKPERWLQPMPESVVNARMPGIYSHLMTFLGGGRACIGFKFSQLEMKVALSLLVSSFRIELSEKEVFWHLSTLSCPSTEPDDCTKPQLPLVIRRLEGN